MNSSSKTQEEITHKDIIEYVNFIGQNIKTDMRAEMQDIKKELKDEMATLKTELKTEIENIRDDIQKLSTRLDEKFNILVEMNTQNKEELRQHKEEIRLHWLLWKDHEKRMQKLEK